MNMNPLPQIRPLSDLRGSIGEITSFVDNEQTPVILTKHGRGKYVLLSMEEYGQLVAKQELVDHLHEGISDVEHGRSTDFSEFMNELQGDIANGKI